MHDLYADPAMRRHIAHLLDVVFGKLGERIAIAEGLGASWYEVSTPFVALSDGTPIAHVGVIEFPLVFEGERRTVAGVHGVCTHPDHRGRGHIRRLLRDALAHIDARGLATAQLTTDSPGIFTSAGFRDAPMTRFEIAPVPRRRDLPPLRKLDAVNDADVALLWRLLGSRAPVSRRLGVVEPGWLLVINEVLVTAGLERIFVADDLDAALVCVLSDDTLRVYDVVAAELPPLDELLARLPLSHRRVELWFTPDRFDVDVRARHAETDDHLMVRGPYPPESTAFYLPPTAHC